MLRFFILFILYFSVSPYCSASDASDVKLHSKDVDPLSLSPLDIVYKVNDVWQRSHSPEVSAFWDEAVYFSGNIEACSLTGNASWMEYNDRWARYNNWYGATESDISKWQYKTYGEDQQHVLFGDWQLCFYTYLSLFESNPDPYKVFRARQVLNFEGSLPQNDFWWWADALYMAMLPMAQLYKIDGDERILDKLYSNFLYADSLMFDAEDGLYYRDAKYIFPAHKTENGKKDFWARGNGWVLAGLAKTLSLLPNAFAGRAFMEERFKQLSLSCLRCQCEGGYWCRSLLDEEQSPGYETSGTALLLYGMMWGVNNGLLDPFEFNDCLERGWEYLKDIALQSNGSVGYVQPIGEKAVRGQVLGPENITPFGTGAFLLAACERVRYEDLRDDAPCLTLIVSNDGDLYRNEVLSIDAEGVFSKLGISGGRQLVITNSFGQQVPYQITFDNKLLLEVSVTPNSFATFTIKKGIPSSFKNACYGRMYPERLDDIAWENDRGAYRLYGPALQASGERAYGNDVWVKNTCDLVVEQRYFTEESSKPEIARLSAIDSEQALELERLTSYHYDHGYGLDCYKVGPTLGCGTPALLLHNPQDTVDNDSLIMPYCYKNYRLLDNGPLRFTVELTYDTVCIQDFCYVEHRLLSLDKCSNFNKMTVWYDYDLSSLPSDVSLVAGVVVHEEDTTSVILADDYVLYADPTDNALSHNFQIFVGALFPFGIDATRLLLYDTPVGGTIGHALGVMEHLKPKEKYTYYFGSAWSKYDCRSLEEWKFRSYNTLRSLKESLKVEIR